MRENSQYKEINSVESLKTNTGKKSDKKHEDTKEVANMNRIDYEAMLLELEYR